MSYREIVNNQLDEAFARADKDIWAHRQFKAFGQSGVTNPSYFYTLASPDKSKKIRLEQAVLRILDALITYAEAHEALYGVEIGDDGAIGTGWGEMVSMMRVFLDGELGRIDPGTMSAIIRDILTKAGFDPDKM